MDDTRKRPGDETAEETAVTKQRDLVTEGLLKIDDYILSPLSKEDDAMATATLKELAMKLLDLEDNEDWPISPAPSGCGTKVTFIDDPYNTPSWIFQTAPSSYVTINGNEESCGSSFSDLASSFMAGVDMCGNLLGIGTEVGASGGMKKNLEVEWDEADLARFIGEDDVY